MEEGALSDVIDHRGEAKHPPFAWHEKIAVLLLAAHLEANEGWPVVRISVSSDAVKGGGLAPGEQPPDSGLDWACVVEAVRQRGSAYLTADLKIKLPRRDYESLIARPRPVWGPEKLLAFLKPALDAEFARGEHDYHRDGIWHDDGTGFDLVAWKPGTTLIVEAKGAGMRTNATREVAQALGKIALNLRPESGYRYGLLVPGDEATFLRILREPEPHNPLIDDPRLTVHSVAQDGQIAVWDRKVAARA